MYKLSLVLIAFAFGFAGIATADHQSEASIEKRIHPTGQVYRIGDDVPVAVAPVAAASGARDGEQVYTTKCAMCHSAGIAGAPKVGDSAAWVERIAQGEAVLFDHAIKGFQGNAGMMPAKGGCADCSDDEVIAAVEHMLGLSQ